MAKVRVHEIAKDLGMTSKDMVDTLLNMGLDVKNHMSTLEESQANWVKKQLNEKSKVSVYRFTNKNKYKKKSCRKIWLYLEYTT